MDSDSRGGRIVQRCTEHYQPFYFLQKHAGSGHRSRGRGLLLGERETSKGFWSHITRVTNWRLGGKGWPQTHSWFSQQDIGRGSEEAGQELLEDTLKPPTALQY